MVTPGKFHPSQRRWPQGMPESIARTYREEPKGSLKPPWTKLKREASGLVPHEDPAPSLNLVHVYCPNEGCDWHVRVDEKVKEYNLEGHLLSCEACMEDPKDSRTPQEAPGDEDGLGSKDSSTGEDGELRTASVEYYLGPGPKKDGSCCGGFSGFGMCSDCPALGDEAKPRRAPNFEEGKTSPASGGVNLVEETLAGGPLGIQRHPNSERFHEILSELGELHDRKQADYGRGDDPFANVRSSEEWGLAPWVGAMVRLNDKVHRLQSLAANGDLRNEAAEDSFRDIAIYAVIALVLYEQGLK